MSRLFPANMHRIDRIARGIVGVALLGLFALFLVGPVPGWGLFGLFGLVGPVLITTAFLGSCPIYTVLGVGTCPVDLTTQS